MTSAPSSAERIVRCPSCGGPSIYGTRNPFRPFCGERCKTQDLSAWASERYAVDAQPDPDPESDDVGTFSDDPSDLDR